MQELIVANRFLAAVLLAFLAGAVVLHRIAPDSLAIKRTAFPALALAATATIALQLTLSAYAVAPDEGLFAVEPLWILATKTWSGKVLAARCVLTAAIAGLLLTDHLYATPTVWVLLAADLLMAPMSGHAATAAPLPVSLAVHGLHVAAALVWIGTVLNLAWLASTMAGGTSRVAALHTALRRFSPVALALILLAVVTGTVAGYLQVGQPAALFGTSYGQLLLAKTGVFLVLALGSAAWLRWRYLPGLTARAPRVALLVEAVAGLGMITVASIMSQSAPGGHADLWTLSLGSNQMFDAGL